MKNKKINILVFPCGSEIGLEIHRSLKYSRHIELFGANSVDDHGKFVFENYIGDIPFFSDKDFSTKINEVIRKHEIDAIYPAMDSVIAHFSDLKESIDCKIIGSDSSTNQICLSKSKTYETLHGFVAIPRIFESIDQVEKFPVFVKPDVGYGSRGAKLITSYTEGVEHLNKFKDCVILENLPGKEYTVDCFTNKEGTLLFSKPRIRKRIMNGISVNTVPVNENIEEFTKYASIINDKIKFKGAWFFQVKEDILGDLSLLEVASRLGGSSSLYRNKGVNFALLSVFDAFNYDVSVLENTYDIVLDRALSNKYNVKIRYDTIYVDFDDCLLLEDKINIQLLSFIYQSINEKIKVILITKHERDIYKTLEEYRILGIFDKIIHLDKKDNKYMFMKNANAIFIDDSHQERADVLKNLNIPVFSPDAVESLLK